MSAKAIERSKKKILTTEGEPKQRSKPGVNQSSTNVYRHFLLNNSNTETQNPSTYKSAISNYNSANPDVWCDSDFSIKSESMVCDIKMQNSSIERSTARERSIAKVKPTLKSKISTRVQGPVKIQVFDKKKISIQARKDQH